MLHTHVCISLRPFTPDVLRPAWGVAWLVLTVSKLGWFLSVGQCQQVVPRVKPLWERDELLMVDGLMAADQ